MSHSSPLAIARAALRTLIVLNVAFGAGILALLVAMLVAGSWTFIALGLSPSSLSPATTWGLRAIALLGLVAIPLNHRVLRALVAMVDTVRGGDPFVTANAARLQGIAWTLLALQLLGLVIGMLAGALSTPANPIHLDAGLSIGGWLAVMLTFVLARVFATGTQMRDELAGTV